MNDFNVEFLFNSNFLFNPLMREFLIVCVQNYSFKSVLKVHISQFYVSRDEERKYMIQIWNILFFIKLDFMDFLFHDHFSLLDINITSISNPMMIPIEMTNKKRKTST